MLFVSVILTFMAQFEFCICIQNHYCAWVNGVWRFMFLLFMWAQIPGSAQHLCETDVYFFKYTFNNVKDLHIVCRVFRKLCPWFQCQTTPWNPLKCFFSVWETHSDIRKEMQKTPFTYFVVVCLCLQIWSAGLQRGSLQSSVQESEWAFGWKTPKPKGRQRKVAFTEQQSYTISRRCARPSLNLICVDVS